MAFNISYTYVAIDRFTAVANKISKSANKISREITKTTQKVGKLSTKVDTSSRSMSKFSRVGGSEFIKTTNKIAPSLERVESRIKRVNTSLNKFGRSLKSVGTRASLMTTLPISLIANSLVKSASDAEETASKFSVVFSSISKDANKTAKMLSRSYGLSRKGSKQLLSDTGDLLTGFGFTQESALNLSTEVQKLAVDLASFTNYSGDAAGASKALTKALLGEREMVKELGISILEEDVKARVKQLVLVDKMKFATMRQAKAFATLQIAQEQSKNAIGDWSRTSDQYANKVRIMKNATDDLKVTLGKSLLPVATKIVSKITEITRKFEDLSPRTQKIILAISGVVAIGSVLILTIGLLSIALGAVLTPVGLVIAKIILIGAGIASLLIKLKPLRDFLISIAHGFRLIAIASIDAINAIGSFISKITPDLGVFEKIGGFFSGIGNKTSGFFGGLKDDLAMTATRLSKMDKLNYSSNAIDAPLRQLGEVTSINKTNNKSRLDGKIVIEAKQGTQIKEMNLTKGYDGNLGFSMGGQW